MPRFGEKEFICLALVLHVASYLLMLHVMWKKQTQN